MTSTNAYEKPYLTNRRGTNDDSIYVIILFKNDNTFIIKKKANLRGIDENGLVTIKDRGKNYVGYCLLEGSLAEIEKAAERLDKEMNTDLESDCETAISVSKLYTQRPHQLPTSTLLPSSSIQGNGSSTTIINDLQKKKDKNCTSTTVKSLALTHLDHISNSYETPAPIDIVVHNKRVGDTSTKQSTGSTCQIIREIQGMVASKANGRHTRMRTFDDSGSDDESDDGNTCEEVIGLDNTRLSMPVVTDKSNIRPPKRLLLNSITPTVHPKPSKRSCKNLSPSDDEGGKEIVMLLKTSLLTNRDLIKDMNQSIKDIKHLTVSVEKLDAKIDALFENQRKIQRALSKNKINVPLNGSQFGAEEVSLLDAPFLTALVYNTPTGEIDLLQLYGVRAHLGRFAALVMDHVFTKEELTSTTKKGLVKDERYQIIKEAVRSRFKLNYEMLNLEWPSLHESILQKRRNEIRKMKNNTSNIISNESVLQATQEEHHDDSDMSDTS